MKIRTAIFGVYVAASALGFAVLMAFILREVRPRYVESMRHTLADTAGLLAVMLEDGRAEDGPAAWRGKLAALEGAAGALRVYVTDARGVVVFDSADGRDVGRDYSRRPEMAAYFKGNYREEAAGGELRVAVPVKGRAGTAGFVGVARPLRTVTEAIWQARLRLIAGGMAVALIMMAAGWWIASRLTHSLERLTAYAVAVREGRGARPPVSRASEVAALARAFEEMRAALEGKDYVERYTQALTHEIKAPLSAIRGAAELLEEEMAPEERARFLAHLRAESARIQVIVDRMLQLASLEARRGLEGAESLEPGGCVREAVEALRPAWAARGVMVKIDGEGDAAGGGKDDGFGGDGAAVRVRGERFLIVQAVTNLLQNAGEFSPRGGTITVRVERGGREGRGENEGRGRTETKGTDGGRAGEERAGVRVVIEDEGAGVPEFARGRIFERFYSLPRPDGGRKSTGLGLSFVREIALLHGGGVSVENRTGRSGARAVLWLPAEGAGE